MIGLQYILELEHMTSKQLCDKINVKPPVVSCWLSDKNPIPAERINQLRLLYPYYPTHYFSETITEKDKITLENAMLKARLEALGNKNSPQGVLIQRRLAKNIEKMEQVGMKMLLDDLLRTADKVDRNSSFRNYNVCKNAPYAVNLVLTVQKQMLEYLILKDEGADTVRRDELKRRIKASTKELSELLRDSYGYLDYDN